MIIGWFELFKLAICKRKWLLYSQICLTILGCCLLLVAENPKVRTQGKNVDGAGYYSTRKIAYID